MSITSFAQNFEDVILWRALHDVDSGFFIDVGAQHPIKDSVSKAFSQQGWRGIHVEPVPSYAELLRADRPDDTVIQAAVSGHNGVAEFFTIEDTGLSTGCQDVANGHSQLGFRVQQTKVAAITLDDLLDLAPHNIHWMKIDVEGMEEAVLSGWKHSLRRPWVIVIEATQPLSQNDSFAQWQRLILEKNYRHVYSDGLNRFYLSDSHRKLKVRFAFPPNIFDGFQLVEQSDYATTLVSTHNQIVAVLNDRIAALQGTIDEINVQSITREQELRNQLSGDAERALAETRVEAQARLDEFVERQRVHDLAAAARECENVKMIIQHSRDFRDTIDRIRQETLDRESHARAEVEKVLQREFLRNEVLSDKLALLTSRLKHTETVLANITQSHSWRFAAPLRILCGERALNDKVDASGAAVVARADNQSAGPAADYAFKNEVCLTDISDRLNAIATSHPRDLVLVAQVRDSDSMASDDIYSILDLLALPISNFVHASYEIFLGRPAVPSELRSRAGVLRAGWGRRRLLLDISRSPEFKTRQTSLINSGDDRAFITRQYQTSLNRTPDPEGLATYLTHLAKGKTRVQVRKQISGSREARLAGGFWYEFELLLADEIKRRQRVRRYFGRSKRLERLQNQEQEISNRLNLTINRQHSDCVAQTDMGVSADGVHHGHNAATAASLFSIDATIFGTNTQRALSRLRHFAGTAPQAKGIA